MLGRSRATGAHLAELAMKYLNETFIAIVADNTGNNSGCRTGLFAVIQKHMPHIFCLGCSVHVLDLLIEDLSKIGPVAEAGDDAHFLASFVRKIAIIYEEFLACQKTLGVKHDLVLFPKTRFAYLHLMCSRAVKNYSVLRLVSESAVFGAVKQQTRKRGDAGSKTLQQMRRFEELVGSRVAKDRIMGAASLLQPFSTVLHYLEGDSVPISHIYPCYQLLYDYAQQLGSMDEIQSLLESEDDQDQVLSAMRDRWLGAGRKVGLKDDVHFCAFALDPYAQAAMTSRTKPECDLWTAEISSSARRVLSHYSGDDAALRSVLIEQFGLWCSASPRVPHGETEAGQSGHNAFSSLYLTGMQLTWDRLLGASQSMESQESVELSSPAVALKHHVHRLKACRKPMEFWLTMQNEAPHGESKLANPIFGHFAKLRVIFCPSLATLLVWSVPGKVMGWCSLH